jgi:cell division protein ZapA (FtsZ GTPase activity inhibitor)
MTAFYKFAIIHCTMTEAEKAEVVAILAIDVQRCLQEYKEKLLWLVHGNHKGTLLPTVEETRLQMKQLKEKIISLLTEIEKKTK